MRDLRKKAASRERSLIYGYDHWVYTTACGPGCVIRVCMTDGPLYCHGTECYCS